MYMCHTCKDMILAIARIKMSEHVCRIQMMCMYMSVGTDINGKVKECVCGLPYIVFH